MTEPDAIEAAAKAMNDRGPGSPHGEMWDEMHDSARGYWRAKATIVLRALLDGGYVVLTDRPTEQCPRCQGTATICLHDRPGLDCYENDREGAHDTCPACGGTGASIESPKEPR